MRSGIFVAIVLTSGALAGLAQGGINHVVVGPYLDDAIWAENRGLFDSGIEKNTPEFQDAHDAFRQWQKGGQVLAGVILGVSMGALFGIVYALSKDALPGEHEIKKACVLAGIMWTVMFLVPFLKYPANPPGAGGDDIAYRQMLYVAFLAISGASAVGFYRISKRLRGRQKLLSLAGYGTFMALAALAMPGGTETMQSGTVDEFRTASIFGTATFWIFMPLLLGYLWHRFRPDAQIEASY